MLFVVLVINVVVFFVNFYILYDDVCMDWLEYVYQNVDDQFFYIMYQVSMMFGEKIILEVGVESQILQDFMLVQFICCNNVVFDEQLVNVINSNIDEVYMVVCKGSCYFILLINFVV